MSLFAEILFAKLDAPAFAESVLVYGTRAVHPSHGTSLFWESIFTNRTSARDTASDLASSEVPLITHCAVVEVQPCGKGLSVYSEPDE